MKKILKSIKPIRRLYDAFCATLYFNHKYIQIFKWMFTSNEDTNYTYDLTQKNIQELIKLMEIIFPDYSQEKISALIGEINDDLLFKNKLQQKISTSSYKDFSDKKIKFSKRIGWYLVTRILKPKVIVETGVDKGLGSMVLCKALEKNHEEGYLGKYYGTDINPNAGYLFEEPLTKYGTILYGDSIKSLNNLNEKVDLFINDSDHSSSYEYEEYQIIKNKISKYGIILGDNAHVTDKLLQFSLENQRHYLFFKEYPKNHWYPGGGIGISFPKVK